MIDKEFFLENTLKKTSELVASKECEEAEKLRVFETELNDLEKQKHVQTQAEVGRILSRKAMSARVDSSKIILLSKQNAIDTVFEKAKQKILKMSDKEYFELIGVLIIKHASINDEVVFSKKDKKRVPKDFLENLSKKHKLSLKMSDETHSLSGGVLLKGKKYDKNLSIDTLLSLARESIESEVSKVLFN